MKYEICDVDRRDMTVCWAIDGGKTFIHFTNDLGELLNLRKTVDIMIAMLEEVKKEEDEKHKQELEKQRSLRAQRAKNIQQPKTYRGLLAKENPEALKAMIEEENRAKEIQKQ